MRHKSKPVRGSLADCTNTFKCFVALLAED